jgi:hypothetical protein
MQQMRQFLQLPETLRRLDHGDDRVHVRDVAAQLQRSAQRIAEQVLDLCVCVWNQECSITIAL